MFYCNLNDFVNSAFVKTRKIYKLEYQETAMSDEIYNVINIKLYNSATNNEPVKHIKIFCEMLKGMQYEDILEKTPNNASNFVTSIYSIITRFTIKFNALFPLIVGLNKDLTFNESLDMYVQDQNSDSLFTFLKITNFEHDIQKYNQRFKIWFDRKKTMMILDYAIDNYAYYFKTPENEIKTITNLVDIGKKDKLPIKPTPEGRFQLQENYGTTLLEKLTSYDYTYLFVKFNKIYTPYKNNKEIANSKSMQKFIENATKNKYSQKPIFLIGYGASGSGKTSSLIYLKKTDNDGNEIGEDGVLI
jgi:hypothetical protein